MSALRARVCVDFDACAPFGETGDARELVYWKRDPVRPLVGKTREGMVEKRGRTRAQLRNILGVDIFPAPPNPVTLKAVLRPSGSAPTNRPFAAADYFRFRSSSSNFRRISFCDRQ